MLCGIVGAQMVCVQAVRVGEVRCSHSKRARARPSSKTTRRQSWWPGVLESRCNNDDERLQSRKRVYVLEQHGVVPGVATALEARG